MVLLDSQFKVKYRSLIAKARREKIRCVKLFDDLYFAARIASGHGRYLIYLDATKSGVFATCRTVKGSSCPSYKCCVHICRVYLSLIQQMKKRERREQAA